MDEERDEHELGHRPRGVSRASLVLLATAAAALGYWGFWIYRPPGSVPGDEWWDLIYYDLQLFGLEFAEVSDVAVPWQLQTARILAPAATFIAAFFAIVGVSSLWRRAVRWGFVIVVGDTPEARAVARAIQHRSAGDVARRAVGFGGVVEISKGDLSSLRAAGVKRARMVYALGDDRQDVAANVATALAGISTRRRRRPGRRPGHARRGPRVFVHVTDPDLAVGLRARRFMAEVNDPSGARIEFFTMDEVAARAYVQQREVFDPAVEQPHILVAGAGAFGQAVIVALAQHWRDTSERSGRTKLKVTLVDEHASAAVAKLRDRWLPVERHCDVAPIDEKDLEMALDRHVIGGAYRAYICYEDEHVALRSALAAAPLWHGGPGSLVVRLSRLSQHAQAFEASALLDNLGERLVVVRIAELAAPAVADAGRWDIYWELAPFIHARYLAHEGGPGGASSHQLWAKLSQDFRDANYDQARHLATKLRELGATVAPRSARNEPYVLTAVPDEDVERLAPAEHQRWMRDRAAHGWRYGPQRNDDRKIRPSMVPWSTLSDEDKDKDRDTIRAIPVIYADALAEFGLQIIRL